VARRRERGAEVHAVVDDVQDDLHDRGVVHLVVEQHAGPAGDHLGTERAVHRGRHGNRSMPGSLGRHRGAAAGDGGGGPRLGGHAPPYELMSPAM
jgi:hypothetical protein